MQTSSKPNWLPKPTDTQLQHPRLTPSVRGKRRLATIAGSTVLGLVLANTSFAAPPRISKPVSPEPSQTGQREGAATTGLLAPFIGISRSSNLLGDMWGLRPWLSQYGLSFALQETSEVLGNVTGGTKQGFAYDGLTLMVLEMDTQRAFDWYGGTFTVSALQIHGRNLSEDNLQTLQTASGIQSDRATRLWELWYEQKLLEEDRLSVKIGQQSLDQEFMVSQNALLFVNTMFGWPMVPSADMLEGGPAYPLSAPGIRTSVRLADSWTVLAGVFTGDARLQNDSGTRFTLDGGALAIAELQYAYPAPGAMVYAGRKTPLARTYRFGVWYDTEDFEDQRFDNTGLSLADPASTGVAQTHRGNYSLYAVADQMIWQDPERADRALNAFIRAMGMPQTDRNLIDFSLNAGLTLTAPFLGRDMDTVGLGMGYAHVSGRAAGLDRDTGFFTGSAIPVRDNEVFVELTYQYQLTPWCQVQPDFQYVFNPGGGVPNPNSASGQRVKDEAVIGLRVNIAF